jgi:hypothetical protein
MTKYMMGMDAKYGPVEVTIDEDNEVRIETGGIAITVTADELWMISRWVSHTQDRVLGGREVIETVAKALCEADREALENVGLEGLSWEEICSRGEYYRIASAVLKALSDDGYVISHTRAK